MNTTPKLALGIAVALITAPALATGAMNNSVVWTTTNGSAIVDSSGNAVRTIHFLETTVKAEIQTPKSTSTLLAVIKKAVAKVLNKEPEPVLEPVIEAVPVADPKPTTVAEVITKEEIPEPVEKKIAEVVVAEEPENPVVVEVIEEELEVVDPDIVIAPVEPVKVEYRFNDYLTTVLFDTNSAVLTDEGSGSLAQLAMATRKAERVLSVQLFGYADSRGDHDYNMALSQQRMLSVEEFLNGQSLNVTSRFAKGETSPILGADGEDLALSRRVDVAIKTRHLKD